ncbi:MAG: undecaprenyl-diphosphate phosphatase [Candidatus Obscuribacterales bacterium]|nr:undecaprenyl-diphosphate phosphatase [Cyanobacteria bacterium SZAS LIN-5]RTL45253.1 MAG: undecaprenyl-diphosphate phosphatase [Candidatus Melainabacteria bacterium]
MTDSPMTLVEAVVLGVVQGLTEFLPISSTAHLRVVPTVLGWGDPGAAYSAVIQIGSVVAVLTYFWKDILSIASGAFRAIREKNFSDQDFRIAGAIAVGTLPICIIGLLLKKMIEGPLRAMIVIGVASLVMGCLLMIAEKLAKHVRGIDSITGKDGFLVGLGQAMALIPGCSRSGSTLTVAMFLDLKREDAARFSFLLGIPALILSGLLELKEMMSAGMNGEQTINLAVGLIVSTISSYAAIAWFIKYLRKHNTYVFVAYRILFGIAVIYLSTRIQ